MLGSINTGGFSKSQVDAMKDSNYFNRKGVAGVYDPIDRNAPVITGSPESNNFLKSFVGNMPGFGKDDEGDSYANRFAKGLYKSYGPDKKSEEEKFYEQFNTRLGGNMGGFGGPVAEGLVLTNTGGGQPTIVGGTQGEAGFFEKAGLAALGGFLCDIRLKEDIAPLCESEVNDVLSECAFFVKDLNECS